MHGTADGDERLLTGYSGRMFLATTLAFLAVKLGQRLLPPLLPVIIDDLAITAGLAGVALSAMRVGRAALQYPSGRLSDRLSRTVVLLPGLGIVLASLVVLSVSPVYVVFLVGVAMYGLGAGLYDLADRALLSDLFREKRGRAFGLHMMASDLAGIVAAGFTVVVVAVATWRAAFLPSILVLAPVIVALYVWSREPLALSRVDLGVRETGARLFAEPRNRWLLVAYSLFVFAGGGVISFLPTFLHVAHGFSFALANSAFAVFYAVGVLSKPVSGTLSDRFPRPLVAGGGLSLAGSGLALLVAAPSASVAIAGVVIYALGQRAFPPAMQAYLMDVFPDSSMGGDLGAMRTVYMGVGSLGPAYVGLLAGSLGYTVAYASIIGLLFVAAAIILRVLT